MASSPIIPYLAQGVKPVQQPDVLGAAEGLVQTRANLAQTQANITRMGAETQQAKAGTQLTQEQTHGAALQNTLVQRQIDAQKTLGALLQKHTAQNPDGSTSTDWGSVMGEYSSLYPDFAMQLQGQLLDRENKQTELAKSQFDLKGAQVKQLGTMASTLGFDNPQFAGTPQGKQAYAQLESQAQQLGIDHLLPTNAQEFNKNPNAYGQQLSQFVQQSGGLAAGLKQKADILSTQQAMVSQARSEASNLVDSGVPYGQAYQTIAQKYPGVFGQLNLPPPQSVTNPAETAKALRLAATTPDQRQNLILTEQKNQAEAAYQRSTAASESTKAGAAATEANVKAAEFNYATQPGGGTPPPIRPVGGVGVPATSGGAPSPSQSPAGIAARPAAASAVPTASEMQSPQQQYQSYNVHTHTWTGGGGAQTPLIPGTPPAQAAPAQQEAQQWPSIRVPQMDGSTRTIDLNTYGPFKAAPYPVQQLAHDFLTGVLNPSSYGGARGTGVEGVTYARALGLAQKINPNFVEQGASRQKFIGENLNTINNANTAIVHSDELMDYVKGLNNSDFRPLNMLKNYARYQNGDPAMTTYENRMAGYTGELQKYLHQGTFTQSEYEYALDQLSHSNSPVQLRRVILDNNRMLLQKLNLMGKQYNDQLGGNTTGNGQNFLQPEAHQVLQKQGLIRNRAKRQDVQDYANQYTNGDYGRALSSFKNRGIDVEQ